MTLEVRLPKKKMRPDFPPIALRVLWDAAGKTQQPPISERSHYPRSRECQADTKKTLPPIFHSLFALFPKKRLSVSRDLSGSVIPGIRPARCPPPVEKQRHQLPRLAGLSLTRS